MKRKERSGSDVLAVLSRRGEIYMPAEFARNEIIFAQGDPADAVFQIRRGKVKLTVSSQAGKEAVISLLGAGDYFGEACLAGQPIRLATARALADCSVVRLPKAHMTHLLREDRTFSEEFLAYALGPRGLVERVERGPTSERKATPSPSSPESVRRPWPK